VAVGVVAVHGGVAALVGLDDGAVEADAGEDALGARVGEDLGGEADVSGGGGVAADGAGGDGGFGAQLELVAEQVLQRVIIHEEQDEVGGRAADLVADAAAVDGDEDRSGPAVAGAATGEAATVGSAEDEGELLVAGDDGDAAGLDEQIVRDAVVGGVHDLFEDLGGLVGAGDVVLVV